MNYDKGDGVQKSLLKLLFFVAAIVVSGAGHALGMGGINVTSALGQPLRADIELLAVGKAERGNMVASLAPVDAYKSTGLEYPYGNKFKFKVDERENGDSYLQITSEQPINDPFVSLLVELTWPSGRLLREYTFLLDPPGYVPAQPVQPDVQVVAPAPIVSPAEVVAAPLEELLPQAESAQAIPVEVATIQDEQVVTGNEENMVGEQAQPMELISGEQFIPMDSLPEEQITPSLSDATSESQVLPDSQASPEAMTDSDSIAPPLPTTEPLPTIPEWVEVNRGDTMYELAEQYKSAGTSVERMLVAMYRANTNEFGGKNMNRIKAGKILRLPDEADLGGVTQVAAEREIRIQAADWNAYRQKLAGAAATTVPVQALQQVAVGKISSSVIDKAPVAKESAKEVLRLSKGEIPGDQAMASAGGKGMSGQDVQNAAQEDMIAKTKAIEEERLRTAMLEQNLKDAQLLAQLKAEAAALATKSNAGLTEDSAAAPVIEAKGGVTNDKLKVVSPVQPEIKPASRPQVIPVETTEPELIEQVLDEPLYLAGGAALLLGLGGLGFMWIRRKKKSSFDEEGESTGEIGEITGRFAAPVVPSPDTGDFTRTDSSYEAQSGSTQQPESIDPINEADLFLSFGRDQQAEDILKEALQNTPSNHQIHLKLLGIYSSRQDTSSFGAIARKLKDSGDEYAWEQAMEMGRKLDPSNPMYGGSGSLEDTTSATVQMAAFVSDQPAAPDFDLGLGTSHGTESPSVEQDFLAEMDTTAVLSSTSLESAQDSGMDFDITSSNSSVEAQTDSADNSGGMDFDVTGSHSASGTEADANTDSDLGMAFTLDFPVEKPADQPAKSIPEISGAGLAGINLNFDDEPASGAQLSDAGDQGQEVETKLDLAKAYQEMGDASGAREILDEVLLEGNDKQRQAAQTILEQLY